MYVFQARIKLIYFRKEKIYFVFWILRILRSFQHHIWQMLWINFTHRSFHIVSRTYWWYGMAIHNRENRGKHKIKGKII